MQRSRREFLLGGFQRRDPAVRPPYALPEHAFLERCTRCAACIGACPTGIVVGTGGLPELDFSRGECTFCGACAQACEPGALGDGPEWDVKADIGAACLAFSHVMCRSCGDACVAQAIRFAPARAGTTVPRLVAAACTGCGACHGVCPAGAISLRHFTARPAVAQGSFP